VCEGCAWAVTGKGMDQVRMWTIVARTDRELPASNPAALPDATAAVGGRLVTTPLPEPVPDTTTPELDALETETRTLIDRHLDDVRDVAATTVASPVEVTRRNSRLVDRLRQARAAIIDTAMGAVRRAVPLGARDAAREAPPPAGTEVRYVPDDV